MLLACQLKKNPVFRVTRPYINLPVKTRIFSGFLEIKLNACPENNN